MSALNLFAEKERLRRETRAFFSETALNRNKTPIQYGNLDLFTSYLTTTTINLGQREYLNYLGYYMYLYTTSRAKKANKQVPEPLKLMMDTLKEDLDFATKIGLSVSRPQTMELLQKFIDFAGNKLNYPDMLTYDITGVELQKFRTDDATKRLLGLTILDKDLLELEKRVTAIEKKQRKNENSPYIVARSYVKDSVHPLIEKAIMSCFGASIKYNIIEDMTYDLYFRNQIEPQKFYTNMRKFKDVVTVDAITTVDKAGDNIPHLLTWNKEQLRQWTIYSKQNTIKNDTHYKEPSKVVYAAYIKSLNYFMDYFYTKTNCDEVKDISTHTGLFNHQKQLLDILQPTEQGQLQMLAIARTGSGKTRMIIELMQQYYEKSKHVFCVVKNQVLKTQLYAEIQKNPNHMAYEFVSKNIDALQFTPTNEKQDADPFNTKFSGRILIATFAELQQNAKAFKNNEICSGFSNMFTNEEEIGNICMIIDEIHLLEEPEDAQYRYPDVLEWIEKKVWLARIGFSATPTIVEKRNKNAITFHKTYTKLLGQNYQFVLYDTPDGFLEVSIRKPIQVNVTDSFYSRCTTANKRKLRTDKRSLSWAQTCLLWSKKDSDRFSDKSIGSLEKSLMTKFSFEPFKTDQSDILQTKIGQRFENEDKARYFFPLGVEVMEFMQNILSHQKTARFMILGEQGSGIEEFESFFNLYKTTENMVKIVPTVLDLKQTIQKQLINFSENNNNGYITSNVLLYNAASFAEGTNVWNVDFIINTSGYKGNYNTFLQAIGRANRICHPGPVSDRNWSEIKYTKEQILPIHTFFTKGSIIEKDMEKVMTDLKAYLETKKKLQKQSVFVFEGDSIKIDA